MLIDDPLRREDNGGMYALTSYVSERSHDIFNPRRNIPEPEWNKLEVKRDHGDLTSKSKIALTVDDVVGVCGDWSCTYNQSVTHPSQSR